LDTAKLIEVDDIPIDTGDFNVVVDSLGDTAYTVEVNGSNTDLTIILTLDSKAKGAITAGTLDPDIIFVTSDSLDQVKAISIDVPDEIDTLIKSAVIIIPYNEDSLGAIPETSLVVLWLNDSTNEWSPLEFTIDTVNNLIIGYTTHFSIFGILSPDNPNSVINEINLIQKTPSLKVYRSPYNKLVAIRYQLPSDGHVSLEVFNTKGKKIQQLINTYIKAGTYTLHWNANTIGSGIYYYKLTAGKYGIIRRSVLVK
jgi:hypothetical protein